VRWAIASSTFDGLSLPDVTFRRALPDDAESLAALVVEGFESYRDFAPPDWRPPKHVDEADLLRHRLTQPRVWALLAQSGSDVVGHVATLPACDAYRPSDEPGLAHLWQLFVRPQWWGCGLAITLHRAALAALDDHAFSAIRLFAAAGAGRARRFYEREGWRASGDEFDDPGFGLPVVEYRRERNDGWAPAGA